MSSAPGQNQSCGTWLRTIQPISVVERHLEVAEGLQVGRVGDLVGEGDGNTATRPSGRRAPAISHSAIAAGQDEIGKPVARPGGSSARQQGDGDAEQAGSASGWA